MRHTRTITLYVRDDASRTWEGLQDLAAQQHVSLSTLAATVIASAMETGQAQTLATRLVAHGTGVVAE
jgi:hypothetical protein